MNAYFFEYAANHGRGAHRLARRTTEEFERTRAHLGAFLGVPAENVVFTRNTTDAINLVARGICWNEGDEVVTTDLEHHANLLPWLALRERGVTVKIVSQRNGYIREEDLQEAMGPATRLVAVNHMTNVLGTVLPVEEFAHIAHDTGAAILVDAAQSVGHLPMPRNELFDYLALPGHKGLLGPQGTGGLYLAPGFEPTEIVQGGGGETRTPEQPTERPDRYESGTPNTPGIAGLGAGAEILRRTGDELRAAERRLTHRLHEALSQIPGIRVLGPALGEERGPLVSVVHERLDADEMAFTLDRRYGIAVRAGLHCTPWTHRTIGTIETGALRFSLGWGLTDDDVDAAIGAMREICA
jgi:selenocysteine lyase/cysteine desulfurase